LLSLYSRNRDAFYAILSELDYKALLRLCRSNKKLDTIICENPRAWKNLYFRDISENPLASDDYKQEYLEVMKDIKTLNPNMILVYAARNGYEKLAETALEHGATDYDFVMALAANQGDQTIIDMMLDHGATDYNAAMTDAAAGGYLDIVDQMIKLGATEYNKAMKYAARSEYLNIVDRMLQLGADNYQKVLIEAIAHDNPTVAEKMLEAGRDNIDINAAMHFAIDMGSINMVKLFLREEIPINYQRMIQAADDAENPEIKELLIEAERNSRR
jgi:ankyrin repeat protein